MINIAKTGTNKNDGDNVSFDVVQNDMTIYIKSGEFVVANVTYELIDDHQIVFDTLPKSMSYQIHVALDENKQVVLLLDDLIDYDWKNSGFERLHTISWFTIPANATTLDDVQIMVHRLIPG